MELFVRSAGRALTRDEILTSVWGTGILVTARSVDRCVTTLRHKIEPDARQQLSEDPAALVDVAADAVLVSGLALELEPLGACRPAAEKSQQQELKE